MAVEQYTARFEKIRTRFAANLGRKIDNLDHALPRLSGESDGVIDTLAMAHRSIHELCGMGPTVGFVATGRAARSVERILIYPLRAKRGLTDSELTSVRRGLDELRAVARSESQSTTSSTS